MRVYPLVSIAIITYNQKDFLRECIESCLSQDYPNLEIVIGDDASSDGTQDMLRSYSKIYPNKFVLCLSPVNQGITNNSNAVHFACSGKYIAWIGGDDLMLPTKISRQVEFMEENQNCSICYHDLDVFDSATNRTLYKFSKKNKPREGGISVLIKYGVFNGACSTMVRRDQTPLSGFNTNIPVASDWLFWVESLAQGGTINYINDVLGRYRRHSGNVTAKQSNIRQGTVDHLNSCNYILAKYPKYFKNAIYCYSLNVRSNRHNLPYVKSLMFCFKNTYDIKSLFVLIVYFLTFTLVKI